ncbi:MAG: hypothetical protein C4308_09915 [Chitinophagaceae bacterium]
MKWRAVVILLIILISLIPAYSFHQFLQKVVKPRNSIGRLFLYMFLAFLFVFIYTFLLVLFIKWLFPSA